MFAIPHLHAYDIDDSQRLFYSQAFRVKLNTGREEY